MSHTCMYVSVRARLTITHCPQSNNVIIRPTSTIGPSPILTSKSFRGMFWPGGPFNDNLDYKPTPNFCTNWMTILGGPINREYGIYYFPVFMGMLGLLFQVYDNCTTLEDLKKAEKLLVAWVKHYTYMYCDWPVWMITHLRKRVVCVFYF